MWNGITAHARSEHQLSLSQAQEKLARQKEARRKAQEEFNALVYFEQLVSLCRIGKGEVFSSYLQQVERRIAPLEKASAMMEADKYRSNLDKSRKRTAEHKKHIEEKQREEEEERERVKAIEEKKKVCVGLSALLVNSQDAH